MRERFLREARRLPLPAGSLLLWSSRTVHQGFGIGKRLAIPVCWEPRSRRSTHTLQRKICLTARGIPSTHWASLGNGHNIKLKDLQRPSSDPAICKTIRRKKERSEVEEEEEGEGVKVCLVLPILGYQQRPRPYGLRPDADMQEVDRLCSALEITNYNDASAAEALKALLRPEVLAAL